MADELEPVTQQFLADVTEYQADIEEAAAGAQAFAAANEEAKAAVDGLRDSSAEAALSGDELRNRLAEVAAAAGITRDEVGKLHDAQGKLVGDSVLTGLALGHERDEALEAAAAFKRLRDAVAEADIAKSGGGLLASLFGGGGGGGAGIPLIGGSLAKITSGISGLADEGTTAASALGQISAGGFGLGAIAIALGAAATEAAALASGFTAAGLGLGAVALVALPFFKQVTGALGDTQAQLAKQPWYIQQTVTELKNVKSQFEGISQAFAPQVSNLASQALGILSDHMDLLGKFAQAALPAISGVLGMLAKGLDSKSFKDFTDYMEKLSGPAITAIGSGMAGLAKDVMQLLTVMSQKDVINGINIAFRILGFTVTALTDVVKYMMWGWDNLTQKVLPGVRDAFDTTRHAVATAGHDIADAFDTVRHAVATAGHDIASAFDTARHAVATAGHDIAHAFDLVRHAVATAVADVERDIEGKWKAAIMRLIDPVGMAVAGIRTHTHEIAQDFDTLRHDVAAIIDGIRHDTAAAWDGLRHDTAAVIDGARHDIAATWDNIRHDIAARVDAIPGDVEKQWDQVRHDAAALGDDVLHALEKAWDSLVSTTSAHVSQVLSFFEKLPGQVLGFLERLPGDMLSIGENIINGLYNGIVNQFNRVIGQVENLASDISKAFTDPLALFSPSRVFFEHGYNIVQGAINGVRANAPALLAAVRGLGTGVAGQGLGSAYAAGAVASAGGSSVHVTVPVTVQGGTAGVSPQYLQSLQQAVQEAVLRHAQLNPTNGLTPAWGR